MLDEHTSSLRTRKVFITLSLFANWHNLINFIFLWSSLYLLSVPQATSVCLRSSNNAPICQSFQSIKLFSSSLMLWLNKLVRLSLVRPFNSVYLIWAPTTTEEHIKVKPRNTKGGSITVPLTSCFTGFD